MTIFRCEVPSLNELEPNTLRCLSRNGISDLKALVSLTRLQLLSLKGFGGHKLKDVTQFCKTHSLRLRPDVEPISIDFVRNAIVEVDRIFPDDLFSDFEWNTPKTQRIINSDVACLKRNLRKIDDDYRLWSEQMDTIE